MSPVLPSRNANWRLRPRDVSLIGIIAPGPGTLDLPSLRTLRTNFDSLVASGVIQSPQYSDTWLMGEMETPGGLIVELAVYRKKFVLTVGLQQLADSPSQTVGLGRLIENTLTLKETLEQIAHDTVTDLLRQADDPVASAPQHIVRSHIVVRAKRAGKIHRAKTAAQQLWIDRPRLGRLQRLSPVRRIGALRREPTGSKDERLLLKRRHRDWQRRSTWIDESITTFTARAYDSRTGGFATVRVSRHLTVAVGISDPLMHDIVNHISETFLYKVESDITPEDVFRLFERLEQYALPLELELTVQRLFLLLAVATALTSLFSTFLILSMTSDRSIDGFQGLWDLIWSRIGLVSLAGAAGLVLVLVFAWRIARAITARFDILR
jgi:hypothetical protein